ncbi:unnamed protein product [Bemisia tabaci]|uniref:Uncharacterized protein n=1 Tax=Bemisia tabaci TaxID=7038 RepID=A0A9P0A3L7_BEMTA|nr:unnamed protein product [Bemisia tabaci]
MFSKPTPLGFASHSELLNCSLIAFSHTKQHIRTGIYTIFNCPQFSTDRKELEDKLGERFTVVSFQKQITSSKENWSSIGTFLKASLTAKRKTLDQPTPSDVCQTAVSGAANRS